MIDGPLGASINDARVNLGDGNPIQRIHDVGAGGLSNALPELVHDSGLGATFEIRDVLIAELGAIGREAPDVQDASIVKAFFIGCQHIKRNHPRFSPSVSRSLRWRVLHNIMFH